MKTPWHVATAAEAFAAAQFSRLGWNVSVQYGANQPEYDLIVADGEGMLKVSVKGSKDGSWGLTQSFIRNADYHKAVDVWLARHGRRTVFCLVQFKGVGEDKLPRMYLATPTEIARRLKQSARGRGGTILHEEHTWSDKAAGAGTTDRVPPEWKLNGTRIEEVLGLVERIQAEDA